MKLGQILEGKNTPTLHFLCGKLAAGKTTLAREIAAEHGAVLICEDIWLQRLFPTDIADFNDYLTYSARLKRVVAPHVRELLAIGQSVVLDFPANVPETRQWIRSIFEAANADHVLHFVDTPNRKCIEQMQRRNQERPEGSVETTVEQFERITSFFRPPAPEEGFNVLTHCRA
ncbi:MAG: ATP-binding protein [Aquisalimonadaceae bacterium]